METKLTEETRVESDLIGAREIPAAALYGVQTLRGNENIPIRKQAIALYFSSIIELFYQIRN